MMVAAEWIQKSTKTFCLQTILRNASKLIWGKFIMQQGIDQNLHTANTTKDFIREKKWKVLDGQSQSPDRNPIEHAFHILKRRLKGNPPPKTKKQLKEAAVKAWKGITKVECNSSVMSMVWKLDAIIASKGYATKY